MLKYTLTSDKVCLIKITQFIVIFEKELIIYAKLNY